ncbi:MAG: phosphoribosyl transferase [Chloroflexota bacterium]
MPRREHRYRDRADAGKQLATALATRKNGDLLVLAIPRGGVPVAAEVARSLGAELDIIVARKLGAPFEPELALGAVTADGTLFLNHDVIKDLGITDELLNAIIAREREEARHREEQLRGSRPPASVAGRTVILVDDGLATGATMRAAAQSVRKRQPRKLIVAVPVGSRDACEALRQDADDVVCLMTPDPFWAVGLYYADFSPVSDEEVSTILASFPARSSAPSTPATANG